MIKPENKKSFQALIHIIGWTIVFGFPLILLGKNSDHAESAFQMYWSHTVVLFSFMSVFYLNYWVLIDRLFLKKQIWKYACWNLLLVVLIGAADHLWLEYMRPDRLEKGAPPLYIALVFLLRDVFMLVLTVGLSLGIKLTYNWYRIEAEHRELENSRTESELKNLKSQLNPHFLFNTLNNIYSLIAFSPDKAQQAVHDLSKLLRYVLYDSNGHDVPVEKELTFIENYIELMRIRLSDSVTTDVRISDRIEPGGSIAPLLFITLVENAFKHGVSNTDPSFVRIDIRQSPDRYLVCEVQNSYFPKNERDKSGSGIGLENLKKRLDLLYRNDYLLKIDVQKQVYTVRLVIPINRRL